MEEGMKREKKGKIKRKNSLRNCQVMLLQAGEGLRCGPTRLVAELGLTYSYLQLDLVNVTGSMENVGTGQQMFVCSFTKRETYGPALMKSA